jgi:hypothetical protein
VLLAKVVLFVVKLDLRAIQLYSLFSGRLLALFQPRGFLNQHVDGLLVLFEPLRVYLQSEAQVDGSLAPFEPSCVHLQSESSVVGLSWF